MTLKATQLMRGSAAPGIQAFQLLAKTPGHRVTTQLRTLRLLPSPGVSVLPSVNWVVVSMAFEGPAFTGTPLSCRLLGRIDSGRVPSTVSFSQPLWDSVPPFYSPAHRPPAPQCRSEGVI